VRPTRRKRLPNWAIGLVLVLLLTMASYMAFAKRLPWTHKYEVNAVFTSAANIRASSPVRIAGVNVGKVTKVEHLSADDNATAQADGVPQDSSQSQAAVVTMELDDSALPIHTDATMKIRPRLFLEGNLFVDIQPGSPSAPEADDGYTVPAEQTSVAVQLDQVLTTLQSDVRTNVQVLLDQFGKALTKYGGAKGFREFYRTSGSAFKNTSLVNEALLGTEPHDLSGLVKNLDSTVAALDQHEESLKDLVTNLATVTGSFAAQDQALAEGIGELPNTLRAGTPALAALNSSFPQVRAFAREALPGVKTTPATLDAATPLLKQVRGLVSKPELRGLVGDLRGAIPPLAKLSHKTVPFLKQGRALSSCFNEVVIPWSQGTVDDPETPAGGKIFQELGYGLEGLNGESRTGDANGEIIRVVAGGGLNTVVIPGANAAADQVGMTPLPISGARPAINSSLKTPFRPDVPCEKQDPPNIDSGQPAAPPTQSRASAPVASPPADALATAKGISSQFEDSLAKLGGSVTAARRGANEQSDAMDALNELVAKTYGLDYLLPLAGQGGKP
jgi:phospholipid/cholesterol/gamma-HCH transport system substrate-binding protein